MRPRAHSTPAASSSQGFSPNCAPSGELKRDSSELYLRHSCTDSYVIHGLRKVQRLENDKRASVDKETEKPDRRSHASVGNYDQLKRHEDSEKDAPSDQEKQQYSRLSTKDYYKQVTSARPVEGGSWCANAIFRFRP